MIRRLVEILVILTVLVVPAAAWCGEADVEKVTITPTGDRIYRFDVTVRHADTGWDHYADRWDVLAPDGTILGSRTLLHPHADEQSFTRSLTGVAVPETVGEVTVRAHDSVHAYGGRTVTVDVSP